MSWVQRVMERELENREKKIEDKKPSEIQRIFCLSDAHKVSQFEPNGAVAGVFVGEELRITVLIIDNIKPASRMPVVSKE